MTSKEIEYYLFEDGMVSGSRYAEREKFWEEIGLDCSGYFPDINQVCLDLQMTRGCEMSFQKTMRALEMVIPHIKSNRDGNKKLGVFEYTLSEYGIYEIEVNDLGFFLNKRVYGIKHHLKTFKSLEELVRYIQEYHYYDEIGKLDEL